MPYGICQLLMKWWFIYKGFYFKVEFVLYALIKHIDNKNVNLLQHWLCDDSWVLMTEQVIRRFSFVWFAVRVPPYLAWEGLNRALWKATSVFRTQLQIHLGTAKYCQQSTHLGITNNQHTLVLPIINTSWYRQQSTHFGTAKPCQQSTQHFYTFSDYISITWFAPS